MRKLLFTVAAAILLGGCVSDEGTVSTVKPLDFGNRSSTYFYQRQSAKVVASCIPDRLLRVLGHIREKTGVRPVLTSGHRSGGRRGSMHRHCLAADIRVPGVSDAAVIAAARTAPGIGGIGRYCNGIVHVDVGPKRHWVDCGGRRKGMARLTKR
nr:D-Ala-D-Ala carboxypeptidase family metallohydrolase [Neorhizobium tomejilense]